MSEFIDFLDRLDGGNNRYRSANCGCSATDSLFELQRLIGTLKQDITLIIKGNGQVLERPVSSVVLYYMSEDFKTLTNPCFNEGNKIEINDINPYILSEIISIYDGKVQHSELDDLSFKDLIDQTIVIVDRFGLDTPDLGWLQERKEEH